MSEANVATPSERYEELERKRALPRTLAGGTQACQDAAIYTREWQDVHSSFLPPEPGEKQAEYLLRRGRTVLYNGYGHTVRFLTGKVFSEPVDLSADVPELFREWSQNIDLTGRNLARFCWDVFPFGIHDGVSFIMVNYPAVRASKPRFPAKIEFDAEGIRPYWTHVAACDVIRWRVRIVNGRQELARVQIKSREKEPDGHWDEVERDIVLVYYAAGEPRSDSSTSAVLSLEKWREEENEKHEKEWRLVEGPTDMPPMKRIPLVPFYTKYVAFAEGEPLLEDMAWLQWSQWLKRSDLDNTLHNGAGVPTLERVGITEEEAKQAEMGVNRFFWSSNPQAQSRWIELAGTGVRLLIEDDQNLQAKLMILGLQPLTSKPAGDVVTATERMIDSEDANSQLEACAISFKDSLGLAWQYTAEWIGETFTGDVVMKSDFSFQPQSNPNDLEWVKFMRLEHLITKATALELGKQLGPVPDDLDVEDELAAAEIEKPELTGEELPLGPNGEPVVAEVQ